MVDKLVNTYDIIYSTDPVDLSELVQDHLDNGCEPYGELKIVKHNGVLTFYQIIVTYVVD